MPRGWLVPTGGSDDESTRRHPSGDGDWRRLDPILAAWRAPATAADDGSDVRSRSVTGVTRPGPLRNSERTGSSPADSRTTFESLNSWIRSAVDPTTWVACCCRP